MKDRGVTPVLGLVLLFGLTAVGALSLLMLSTTMFGDAQSTAQTEQAEASLSSLAQSADRLAAGEVDRTPYDLGHDGQEAVRIEEDAGFYEVTIERETGTEVLTNGSLGAYEYETEDGTRLAFQGGGVFRRDAFGYASVVRSPEFHYRTRPEPTLTLPVVRIESEGDGAPPSEGTLDVSERRNVYPVRPNHTNPLHEGEVYLHVRSEYCGGWEQFFGARTDGAIVESCAVDGSETGEDEVLVKLSVPFNFGGLGGHTAVAERITGAGDVHGSTREGPHSMTSATGVVEQKVEDCRDSGGENVSTAMTGGGLYCAFDHVDEHNYRIDPEGEDVEIVVDGRFEPRDFRIVGDGTVTVFVNGPALPMPGDVIGNPSRPEQLRIVVKSGCAVGGIPGPCGGGPRGAGHMDVYGLIYAPNSVVDFAGNGDLYGGVVGREINLQSGAASVHPDPDVLDIELEFERGGEPFYYLHVSETTVRLVE